MRYFGIVVGVLTTTVVVSAGIWSYRYAPWVQKEKSGRESTIVQKQRKHNELEDLRAGREPRDSVGIASDPTIDPRPRIAENPPFPKLVIEDRVYKFGKMEVGNESTHAFRIQNKGDGSLVIGRGPTTCQCTISKVSGGMIAPGGTADVELHWKPAKPEREFHKSALIWTNDPNFREVVFEIDGEVLPKIIVEPSELHAGEVTEEHSATAVGLVGSPLDPKFKIVSVEPADPNLSISYKPVTKAELDRRKWSAGYELTATVGQGIPWGRYRSSASIRTSQSVINVDVTATRTGTIRFLQPVSIVGHQAATWSANKTLLNLGIFPHDQGRKVAIPALVSSMKENLRVASIESNLDFLKILIEPDPEIRGENRQGCRFVIEVPPGSPPISCPSWAPAHVKIKTNHPTLSEIEFDVALISK
jgi:Protein of unknown function (DUF1573)